MNLLELDAAGGSLRTRQRIPVSGILPEGVTFDASGNHVALTVYDRYRRGAVKVYALHRGGCAGLVPTGVELEVPSAPHSVLVTG